MVAQRRAGSGCEQCGPGSAAVGGRPLADLIDAAISRLQAPTRDPAVDDVPRKAGAEVVGPRNHAVLPSGDQIDDNVT
jgi:hypothetical protein